VAKRVYRRILRPGNPNDKKKWKYIAVGGGVLALLIVVLSLVLGGNKTFAAEQGSLYFSAKEDGLIIRSEKLYEAGSYGKAEFIALEGQAVSAGTSIAAVYSTDYSEKDYTALKELQEKILDYQQNNALSDVPSKDLAALDAQIAAKAEEARAAVTGSGGELIKIQRELVALMTERAGMLKESAVSDKQLTDFYEQETALINRIETYRSTIVADGEGLVSFYFDGLEALLTPENMDKLTVSNIADIIAGKLRSVSAEVSARPLYRLVEQNLWYVAFVSDKEAPEFTNDNIFQVQFSFGEDYIYSATVCGHTEESGKYIYSLKFTGNVDKLLSARQVSFMITAEYVGIVVPKSALKEKSGVTGVYYLKNGVKTFEPVDVLIIRDDEAIIISVNIESPLDYGSEIFY